MPSGYEQLCRYVDRVPGSPVVQVRDGSVRDSAWLCLLAAGYQGQAGDNREAIYAPRSVVDSCTATVV